MCQRTCSNYTPVTYYKRSKFLLPLPTWLGWLARIQLWINMRRTTRHQSIPLSITLWCFQKSSVPTLPLLTKACIFLASHSLICMCKQTQPHPWNATHLLKTHCQNSHTSTYTQVRVTGETKLSYARERVCVCVRVMRAETRNTKKHTRTTEICWRRKECAKDWPRSGKSCYHILSWVGEIRSSIVTEFIVDTKGKVTISRMQFSFSFTIALCFCAIMAVSRVMPGMQAQAHRIALLTV